MVVNCDGVTIKVEVFKAMVDNHRHDIILGSESKLGDSILNPESTPPGYTTIRKDRNINGGGVFIMVTDLFVFTEMNVPNITTSELIWIHLYVSICGRKPLVIG